MGKIFKIFTYGLSLLVVSAFVYLYLSSPVYNGYVTHNHSKYGIVYIRRDEFGIPTIKGSTLKDTMFGLGFTHCQDRQWSMDIQRRLASGRLSELFGNRTLEVDIAQREFGLLEIAKKFKLDEKTRESIQAYTDGVNECNTNKRARSLEYVVTRSEFEEWKVEDTLSVLMLIQLHLTQDYPAELIREKISRRYTKPVAQRMSIHWEKGHIPLETILTEGDVKKMGLYEHYDRDQVYAKGEEEPAQVSEDQIDKLLKSGISEFLDHQRGSNSWAIHGNHTNTGKPIVANDPHLGNGIPSFWYQAQLIYQSQRNITISGSSVPGIPGIFSGLTDYVAWGVTALCNDISDFYSEQLNENQTQYFFDGKWRDLKIRNEVIKVKGLPDQKITIRETHHGPILNSAEKESSLAFSWVNRIQSFNFLNSFYDLYEATHLDQVVDSFSNLEANFGITFGTNDNHIGFFGTGIMPIRANPTKGSFIQNGTDRKNDWKGFLPKKQNPHVIDPERGFVVAANNKMTPNSAKGFPSVNMPPTSRAIRIREMIEQFIKEGKKISVEDVKLMQQDTVDVYAREVINPMITIYEKHKLEMYGEKQAQTYDNMMNHLKNWTSAFDKESVGATIFSTINFQIGSKMLYIYSPDKDERYKAIFYYHLDTFLMNQIINWSDDRELDAPWCDDNSCFGHKTKCLKLFFVAIKDTFESLTKQLGPNISEWQWQKVHHKKLPHTSFKNITYVSKILDRSYPAAGNKRSVGVNAENYKTGELHSYFSANMRAVYSLDKNDKSYYVVDTGVSESVMSSHYADQMKLYEQGQYVEVKRDLNKLKDYNKDMLLLVFDPKKDAQSQSEFGTDQKQKKDQTKKDDQKTDM